MSKTDKNLTTIPVTAISFGISLLFLSIGMSGYFWLKAHLCEKRFTESSLISAEHKIAEAELRLKGINKRLKRVEKLAHRIIE